MLILSRRPGERITALKKVCGGYAALGTIIVDKIEGNRVKIALEFGPDVILIRPEAKKKNGDSDGSSPRNAAAGRA